MIRFTQYLRPDGRPVPVDVDRSAEVERRAEALSAADVRLEAEVLPTGEVSFTAEREDEDGEVESLASEIVQNGPAVLDAVDRLITTAYCKLWDEGETT
jgi:hypothetical protein